MLVNITLLVTLGLLALAVNKLLRDRMDRKQRGLLRPWPIPMVDLTMIDPVFTRDELGPCLNTEVRFISGGERGVPGGTSDLEAWILAVLATQASEMFEFGTCTGRTTWLWACNSAPETRIHTLTLPPAGLDNYQAGDGDDAASTATAKGESVFTRFLYSGTAEEAKIEQLYGDSKTLDETPFLGRCDLIFIDGSHAFSYIKNDTEKALRMLRPGGLLLWHDYRGPRRARDVYRYLNQLVIGMPLMHIRNTSLVAFHKP